MKKKYNLQDIILLSILAAITILISFLPIKTLGLEITLSIIPITVGIILCGLKGGLILGSAFGIISFIQCLGYSPFGVMVFSINPFYAFLMCVPTRIFAAVIVSLIYKCFEKKNVIVSEILASIFMPILNTVCFMTVMLLCFYNTEYIQGFASELGSTNPFEFAVLFVGINGLVEMLLGIFISFPIAKAINVVRNRHPNR